MSLRAGYLALVVGVVVALAGPVAGAQARIGSPPTPHGTVGVEPSVLSLLSKLAIKRSVHPATTGVHVLSDAFTSPTTTRNGATIGAATTGNTCDDNGVTGDYAAYVETYPADSGTLYSDVLFCSNGGATPAETYSTIPSGCSNPFGQGGDQVGPCVFATFPDAEGMVPAPITPDDNGTGGSNALPVVPTFYQQAFPCQATVGVGPTDSTTDNIDNQDSLEVYTPYTDYDGNSVASVTTTCIGALPTGTTIDTSAPVTHVVRCSETNPYQPSGFVQGLGTSVTYPDGQYGEICNVPNYPVPVG